MLNMTDEIGTMKPGMVADITVLADERGKWVLRDNSGDEVWLTVIYYDLLRAGKRFDADAIILRNSKQRPDAFMNDAPQGSVPPFRARAALQRGRGRYIADIKPNGVRCCVRRSPLRMHAFATSEFRRTYEAKSLSQRPQRRPRHSPSRAPRFQGIGTAHPCER